MIDRVTNAYEHALQSAYWDIGNRGISVLPERLEEALRIVNAETQRNLAVAANQWGCIVFAGAENAPVDPEDIDEDDEDAPDPADLIGPGGAAVNINATKGKYALLTKLKDLGYNIPKITGKDSDGNYLSKESAGELAIQKMLSENQFGYPGGDPALRAILKIRELGKLKSSYLGARLARIGGLFLFLTNYNAAGTLSGRRSSRRHTFNFGNNAQNFPKHSKIASLFRRCLVARPGNILLFVDQIQAEDWPVSALSGNLAALQQLRDGVDRHSLLATSIWGHRVPAKSDPDWDDALYDNERYIGKKARHSNNYGVTAPVLQDAIVKETEGRICLTLSACKDVLDRVNRAEPLVRGVFHKYVIDSLSTTRVLTTPLGRERQFLSLRPNDYNGNAIKEAFAFIPQSTVGDNTGFSLLQIENNPESRGYIVQEGHDSLVQDVPDSVESLYHSFLWTQKAFERTIRFHNGLEINIPIEAEIGYDFAETVKVKKLTLEGFAEARQKLQDKVNKSSQTLVAVGA